MKRMVTWDGGESSTKRSKSQPRMKQFVKRPKGPSPSLRAYIKSTINRLAEKKCVIAHGENINVTTAAGVTPLAIALAPTVSQGTSQNQRIGNQIRIVKGTIRGHLSIKPVSVSNAYGPVALVKMWIVRYRPSNPAAFSSTDAASAFFDTGAGTSGMIGNIYDMEAWINNDSYELITERVVKIGASSGTADIPSTTVGTAFDNSPAVVPFRFEFGSKLGNCLFNDTGSVVTNKNLFLVFQPVMANGTSGGSGQFCELHYSAKCDYIDL